MCLLLACANRLHLLMVTLAMTYERACAVGRDRCTHTDTKISKQLQNQPGVLQTCGW